MSKEFVFTTTDDFNVSLQVNDYRLMVHSFSTGKIEKLDF